MSNFFRTFFSCLIYDSYLEFNENTGERANGAQDLPDQTVSSTERRLDFGANTDEATRHGELQLVLFGVQRNDARENRSTRQFPLGVFAHQSWSHLK